MRSALRATTTAMGGAWRSMYITRSPATALDDVLFHRVSGIVASETVLAHVRRATNGELSVLNCHPFQYGKWIMAHNGDIQDFAKHRPELVQRVAPMLRPALHPRRYGQRGPVFLVPHTSVAARPALGTHRRRRNVDGAP
ncbi:MAG: class II glutamine amidotransferase [Deltaproteobacteria bacterium]|nr:class II glutamine amidotransferase [Deltaproteobacteria bacterium]